MSSDVGRDDELNEADSKRTGRGKSLDDILEQALVQIFLGHVDITIVEALDWLEEEFK
jgi:hypothetical protein